MLSLPSSFGSCASFAFPTVVDHRPLPFTHPSIRPYRAQSAPSIPAICTVRKPLRTQPTAVPTFPNGASSQGTLLAACGSPRRARGERIVMGGLQRAKGLAGPGTPALSLLGEIPSCWWCMGVCLLGVGTVCARTRPAKSPFARNAHSLMHTHRRLNINCALAPLLRFPLTAHTHTTTRVCTLAHAYYATRYHALAFRPPLLGSRSDRPRTPRSAAWRHRRRCRRRRTLSCARCGCRRTSTRPSCSTAAPPRYPAVPRRSRRCSAVPRMCSAVPRLLQVGAQLLQVGARLFHHPLIKVLGCST